MAQNVVVNFIGQNKLSKTTAVMSADLKKFQNTANSVSSSLNKAFGAAGLTLGFAQLTNVLKQSTKAAVDDGKSQALLANALRNTVGATAGAIAGAERYIAQTQLTASVLDDDLRPALATAVRATGSLSKGQRLLNVALDVSAGTGKDLGTVTNAMAKAYNGNTGALKKLLPSIKDGTNFMKQLDDQFKGSAETAANKDPYKALQVIFADIQETIGRELIPALQEFTLYLKSPEGQKSVRQVVGLFIQLGQAVKNVTTFVIENIVIIKGITAAVLTAKIMWGALTGAVKLYDLATKIAVGSTKALKFALVTTGIGAVVALVGTLASSWLEAADAQEAYYEVPQGTGTNGNPFGPGIAEDGTSWIALGFGSEQEYLDSLETTKNKIIAARDKALQAIADTGKKFRDAIGLNYGIFGKDENSVFNIDIVIAKLKRMVDAAKGFKDNLAKLTKQGAGQDVINELIALGPAQGNIAAKGLLQSGRLSEYLGLRGSLQTTGQSVQTLANSVGEKTYNLNINKANVSAEDIIKAIQKFEKTNGRKVFSN